MYNILYIICICYKLLQISIIFLNYYVDKQMFIMYIILNIINIGAYNETRKRT